MITQENTYIETQSRPWYAAGIEANEMCDHEIEAYLASRGYNVSEGIAIWWDGDRGMWRWSCYIAEK